MTSALTVALCALLAIAHERWLLRRARAATLNRRLMGRF